MLSGLRRWLPALASLDDETRRRLYLFVRAQGRPVTRDEAAAHVGVSQRLAAFHLEKLVGRGLLAAHYARKPGRSGPGAGRTSKYYRPSEVEIDVTIPERRYAFVGEILVGAITSSEGGEPPRSAALRIAGEKGQEFGREARRRMRGRRSIRQGSAADIEYLLADLGFEPVVMEEGTIALRSCPFDKLARQAPDLVCGMNHAFVEGLLQGIDFRSMTASLEPTPGHCCVRLRA
jgi:predicted ArsR family transcriptional regulator